MSIVWLEKRGAHLVGERLEVKRAGRGAHAPEFTLTGCSGGRGSGGCRAGPGGRAFDEAAAELSEKFPDYAAYISAWGDRFGETISDPVPGMHALVEQLHARGVPLFAITNFSADFWKPFRAREDAFFRRFRDVVVSGEEKLLKPDPALYFRALDRFGLKPHEALFIDDRQINVEGAEAVGMHAHLFTDAEGLRRRLEAEGLL